MNRSFAARCLTLALVLVAAGCGSHGGGGGGASTTTATTDGRIGPEGGSLAANGVTLTVPAGVLAARQGFSIAPAALLTAPGYTWVGEAATIAAIGLASGAPVIVSLPFDPARVEATGRTTGELVVLRREASGALTPIRATIEGTLLRFETRVLGTFEPVVVARPSASLSSVTAMPATALASGRDAISIEVVVRDLDGAPIPNVPVALSAADDRVTIAQPASTGSDGRTGGRLTTVAPGARTVTATAGGLVLGARPTVTFVQAPVSAADVHVMMKAGTLVKGAGTLVANDGRGTPEAVVVSFGGGSLAGSVRDHAAGEVAEIGSCTVTVGADGSFAFTPRPTFTGAFEFSYRLENSVGSSDGTVTILVEEAPAFTCGGSATFVAGASWAFQLTATGYPAPTFSIVGGALPAGLTLDGTSGTISGTAATGSAGAYALTLLATNGAGTAQQSFTVYVIDPPALPQ